MTLFYSPSASAFYDDAVHGARRILVEDEARLHKALHQLTERELALMPERGQDEGHAITAEERAAMQSDLDVIALARSALLETPPMVWVDNPNCRLPDDAMEIAPERHTQLMRDQADGRRIVPGADGMPVSVARESGPADLVAAVKKERNRLLKESDWTQMADNELSKDSRAAWKAWRRAVRETARRFEANASAYASVSLPLMFPVKP
jgi:hypothetical protein